MPMKRHSRHVVRLTHSAAKQLTKIDTAYRGRIEGALQELSHDPYYGKPLSGELKGYFSVRVWPYRIIYTIVQQELVVEVIAIAHRQGAYR